MTSARRVLCLFLPALLAGCTREVRLAVERVGDTITFIASRPGEARTCIDNLTLRRADPYNIEAPVLWGVATGDPDRCEARFTYGVTPPGFSAAGPAPRLRLGGRYAVEVNGAGLIGGGAFVLRADDGAMELLPL
jgi:hypothetical protein